MNFSPEDFYFLPKNLFRDPKYLGLSSDAILLYAALCELRQYSYINGWLYEDYCYVEYPRDQVSKDFKWGNQKTVKMFKQLKNYNLIDEKKTGLNMPNKIFVNFKEFKNENNK